MIRSLSDPKTVIRSLGLYSLLYVTLQLTLISPSTETLTGILFFLVFGVAIAIDRRDILVVSLPFIFVQHAFTSSIDMSSNWVFGSFIFPVSMVHVITGIACLFLVWQILSAGQLQLDQYTVALFIMLGAGILTSRISSPSEFLIDVILLVTAIVYSLYIANALTPTQIRRILWYVLLVPAGIAWGSVAFFVFDAIVGTTFYNSYLTIQLFVFTVIVGVIFERDQFPPFFFKLYLLTTIVYLGVFFAELVGSGSGTSTLAILFTIFVLGVLKQYQRDGFWNASVLVGVSALTVGCGYLTAYFFIDINLPLQFLVYKLVSLFTFNLSQIEHSPAVRIIELLNITAELLNRGFLFLLFGDGLGSYFTDVYYPFERYVSLGPADFSARALQTGRYYTPHTNFGGYIFLKYGLFGVGTMLAIAINGTRTFLNTRGVTSIIGLALVPTVTVFGFGIKNSIIFGTLLGLYVLLTSKKSLRPSS